MPLPDQLAFHIQRHKLARGEPGVDHASIGDATRTSHVVHAVDRRHFAVGVAFGVEDILPDWFAVLAGKGLHRKADLLLRASLASRRTPWKIAGAPFHGTV